MRFSELLASLQALGQERNWLHAFLMLIFLLFAFAKLGLMRTLQGLADCCCASGPCCACDPTVEDCTNPGCDESVETVSFSGCVSEPDSCGTDDLPGCTTYACGNCPSGGAYYTVIDRYCDEEMDLCMNVLQFCACIPGGE
ncbi:MAG: hypothetical protein KIS92_00800 [Planctomycetota bacterium]|nr:hypothetical protein [Planctomycetota bacterium]